MQTQWSFVIRSVSNCRCLWYIREAFEGAYGAADTYCYGKQVVMWCGALASRSSESSTCNGFSNQSVGYSTTYCSQFDESGCADA